LNETGEEALAWRRDYEENGFLVVENALEPEQVAEMRAVMDRIERDFMADTLPGTLRRHIATERSRTRHQRTGQVDSDVISNVMELPLFDPVFKNLIVHPRVLDVLEALFTTSEFAFHNYKCICKMPGNKAPFAWHRDLPYLQHTSPDLITCMLCLDDMTVENGATVVCPGTHRIPHEEVKASDTDMDESEVPEPRVAVVCPAGSAVLFHVNLIHGGGPNLSTAKRRNAISIWSAPGAYPTTPARYAYQGVMPRSTDPQRQKQIEMTFPKA
jgi:ectoine hydroxylase-related dioxygenase (phytanoyl-CoA dioxygenase family)